MNFQLSFRQRQRYALRDGKPSLRAILTRGEISAACEAYIDSGATVCLFQRELADNLGLSLFSGERVRLSTLTGPIIAYGHEVRLQTGSLSFETTVYFAAEYGLSRNLLGKFGFLQLARFGMVDYDEMIYLSHYDDPV
jgi:hypothetical protein